MPTRRGNRYRFRVQGYDQNWVEQGGDGQRTLSRLPTGSYVVKSRRRQPVAPGHLRNGCR